MLISESLHCLPIVVPITISKGFLIPRRLSGMLITETNDSGCFGGKGMSFKNKFMNGSEKEDEEELEFAGDYD